MKSKILLAVTLLAIITTIGISQEDKSKTEIDEPISQAEVGPAKVMGTWEELNQKAFELYRKGAYETSVAVAKQAVKAAEASWESDAGALVKCLNTLALSYLSLGRAADAVPLYERALKVCEESPGPERLLLAQTLNNVADFHRCQGDHAKATHLFRRALEIMEGATDPDDAILVATLNNFAMSCLAQGDLKESSLLLGRAYKISEEVFGPKHEFVARTLNNVGFFYSSRGKYSDAQTYYENALQIMKSVFGPSHPELLPILHNLAYTFHNEGFPDRAESLCKRELRISEETFGPNSLQVAEVLDNFASLYEVTGRNDEAQRHRRRALTIRREKSKEGKQKHSARTETSVLPGGVEVEMVWVPPGSFLMGNPHRAQTVTFTDGFWMGKYEVTKAQWMAVMGTKPWTMMAFSLDDEPNSPAGCIPWQDAQTFIKKLNALTGKAYRLPSEAEWEYACRAGTSTHYFWGDDRNVGDDYVWWKYNCENKNENYAHIVGQQSPNPFGLYDMIGNIAEWCSWDTNGMWRVLRGGNFMSDYSDCLPTNRHIADQQFPIAPAPWGFRLARYQNPDTTMQTSSEEKTPKVNPPTPTISHNEDIDDVKGEQMKMMLKALEDLKKQTESESDPMRKMYLEMALKQFQATLSELKEK